MTRSALEGLLKQLKPGWRGSRQVVLLLDYDGTLVPHVAHPNLAVLPSRVRQLLRWLRRQVVLVVISGRALGDLKRRVGIRGLIYAGNHGLEIEGPGLRWILPDVRRVRHRLARLAPRLRRAFRRGAFGGAWVEEKGLTLTVHYRALSASRVAELRQAVYEVAAFRGGSWMRLTSGDHVLEVRPSARWGKGEATLWILRQRFGVQWRFHCLPLYVGNDETDREVFPLLRDRGVTIAVGQQPPQVRVHYTLRDPGEVEVFLARLTQAFT